MKNRKYRPVAFILSLFCLAFPLSACSGAEGEGGGGGTVPPAEEPSPPQELLCLPLPGQGFPVQLAGADGAEGQNGGPSALPPFPPHRTGNIPTRN